MRIPRFFIFYICLTLPFNVTGQINKTDSLEIKKNVIRFYNWYVAAIEDKIFEEFRPVFSEDINGMATLNLSVYLNNLEKFGFSDSLIQLERQSYKPCIDNLAKLKYSEFKSKWTDLDDFEQHNCDFGNYYRWIGGMEPIDGIRVTKVEFKNQGYAFVNIEYFTYGENNNKDFWGRNVIELIKIKHLWQITNIQSWKN
jgi:hypothetical protein